MGHLIQKNKQAKARNSFNMDSAGLPDRKFNFFFAWEGSSPFVLSFVQYPGNYEWFETRILIYDQCCPN